MFKYPRTNHVVGSRLQPGDEELEQIPWKTLRGRHVVVEEKLDGANCGISFSPTRELLLQSRGHFLTGGPRERQFDWLKRWAAAHREHLWRLLGDRYVVYGEWLYGKHTIFYDELPHYFVEYDMLDTQAMTFLNTPARLQMLHGSGIPSAPILRQGPAESLPPLTEMNVRSAYRSARWRERLRAAARQRGLDPEQVFRETDASELGEGLYIKVEADGRVHDRLKWIRASYFQTVIDSGSHWFDRPILPNGLRAGVDLFASGPC